MESFKNFEQKILDEILKFHKVDAVYLYGSRAKGTFTAESDWDIAVLYCEFIKDLLERTLRPQMLEAHLEKILKMYNKIHVVDLEIVPVPLQYNIIKGNKLFDRMVPHVRKVENAIISKIELDYTI